MATMCAYPPYQHALPHCKCVLHWCYNFLYIDLLGQESDIHHSKTSPSIIFHVYHFIESCTVHGRRPLDKNKIIWLCLQFFDSVPHAKLYTIKEIFMMETSFAYFCTIFYIPEIQNLALNFPHVQILGTNHFGNTHHEAFKHHRKFQDVLCRRSYT